MALRHWSSTWQVLQAPILSYGLRRLSSGNSKALEFCIVGSGPAGFYVADRLLKNYGDGVKVTIVDRLATPFGLVRSGVAPDHPDTKNVINQFGATLKDERVSFLGNVTVGKDVSLDKLRSMFHGVVLSYGAESDRKLGIKGEDAPNVFPAREYVWWYNGHPDSRELPVELSKVESVAVCGIGNVALDCARLLLRSPDDLSPTDLASHALRQLRESSSVKEVHIMARRGPVQAACTPKELKELLTLPGISASAAPDQLALSTEDQAEVKATRIKRRVVDIITSAVAAGQQQQQGDAKKLHFQFYRSPVEIVCDDAGMATGVKVEHTEVISVPGKGSMAKGTGQFTTIPAQLVLVSIGYKSKPLEGAPFDQSKGVIPNVAGRVLAEQGSSEVQPGLYVCGWLKRGPSGIIGTNLVDAAETASSIQQDTDTLPAPTAQGTVGGAGLQQLLEQQKVEFVTAARWQSIDAAELAAGAALGRSREKFVRLEDMLAVA